MKKTKKEHSKELEKVIKEEEAIDTKASASEAAESPDASQQAETPETVEADGDTASAGEAKKPKKEKKEKKEKKQTKAGKVINIIVNVVLVAAIILAALSTYTAFVESSGQGVPSIFGISILSIQTPSMAGTIDPGDLAIDIPAKPEELRPGDIITYWTVINGQRDLNTHRIQEIYSSGEGENSFLIFETKGDAEDQVDMMTVHEREIVGKYWFRIPKIGKAFDYLKTPTGFFLIVVIPVFAFFIYHLVRFFRTLFEYQNVKNRLKFELERGKTEDMIAAQKEAEAKLASERAAMEAELREKLKAEILADIAQEKKDTENE